LSAAPEGSAPPIEDYALIGDCTTAALVSRSGSIDWLCVPRLDSNACLAALLGTPDNGRWSIRPADEQAKVTRRYVPGTMVLETTFETSSGCVTITDFMIPEQANSSILRILRGVRGTVDMRLHATLRFDYGLTVPWVTRLEDGSGLRAIAGPDMMVIRSPVQVRGEGMSSVAEFGVAAGESLSFEATHVASHLPIPDAIDAEAALKLTLAYWTEWSGRCTYAGPWKETLQRSLLTLKALTYAPTGGIAAAATTSLPEKLGGVRNWDYRYCWLRDATLTLMSMMHAGYVAEAESWRQWLQRSIAGSPDQMQIMYGLAGERRLAEWEVEGLPGYQGAAPVRVGNAAHSQLQLDVYGEVMDAFYQGRRAGLGDDANNHGLQRALLHRLEELWHLPDQGMWESRGPPRHYTSSKVMAWVAFDRAVRFSEEFAMEGPADDWRRLRDEIHAEVCEKGWNARKNCFTQYFGGEELDASLLSMALVGFLPPDDPRVVSTLAAVERELVVDGLVLRYRTDDEDADGLPKGEGVFLACSFWLADNMVLQGRKDEARALFDRLLALQNDVGLLSEEYDPRERRMTGNFPQAFSHIGLINTIFNLGEHGPALHRAAA
jgi:GH15 family glucan-1,4-alpha-glucosidase